MATRLHTHFRNRLDALAEYVTDLHTGGILVLDRLDPEAGPITADEQVAFRTLVQLDGDVTTQIARAALASPNFAAAYTRHLERIGETIVERHARLRRWVVGSGRLGSLVCAGLSFAAVYGTGSSLPRWTQLSALGRPALVSVSGAIAASVGAAGWRWIARVLVPAIATRVIAARFAARTRASNPSQQPERPALT